MEKIFFVKCPNCRTKNSVGAELSKAYRSDGDMCFSITCQSCGCVFSESDTCESDLCLSPTEANISSICEFVKAYETRKYQVMKDGGTLLSVSTFMVDYCQSLRDTEAP